MNYKTPAFTDLFIKRPVLAIVVNLVIIIAGIQAFNTLNVRQYPKNENAIITITTAYIGADADLVRGFITVPLERVIASADGIEYMESSSVQGLSTISAKLRLNYDGQKALAEISTKVDQVRNDLPPESEISIIEIQNADEAIAAAYLRFGSEILEPNQVTDYLARIVQPRLTAIPGVQEAEILGARTFAMRIWMIPEKMAALNVSPAEVRTALAANNYLSAVGQTKGAQISLNLTANTDLQTVEEFEELVIREQGGSIIRLRDVANVMLGAQDYTADVKASGKAATFMGISVMPNANALDVIAAVLAEMELIKEDLPEGMEAGIAYDSTEYIQDAINEVYSSLGLTIGIVIIVIFLFLGSVRAVIVPVITIPLSLIGAIFLMQVFGFTINLLTLLAVVLAVGLVVDDAIVVVENIERHLAMGKKPFIAALHAARELISPVIATTITLAAVYTPIAIQGGLTGAFFLEFAFTLAGAVIISTFVALTLSPMMSSKLLRSDESERGLAKLITDGFNGIRNVYSAILNNTLTIVGRVCVYLMVLFFVLLIPILYMLSPKELAPEEDQGFALGVLDTPSYNTLDHTVYYADQVFDVYSRIPEYDFSFHITFPNAGFAGVALTPWSERDRNAIEIRNELQAGVGVIPGVNVFMVPLSALPSGSQFPVEFVITSTAESEEILGYMQQIQQKAATSDLFAFPPSIDVRIDRPQTEIIIDRDKVADLGLTLQSVGQDLTSAMSGNFVNRFNIEGRSYRVIPQISRLERLTPDQLQDIYINGRDGAKIPLSTIATLKETVEPRSLNRFQQMNSVKLSGVATQTLDAALTFLEEAAAEVLPPTGFNIDYTGESRQLREEGGTGGFLVTMGLAAILIFLVLAAQYNSFRDPMIILAGSVPLGIFGALVFTFMKILNPNMPFFTDGFSSTFNIYSQVGLVTLVGLISKNGILIVEFANQLQKSGLSKMEAIKEGAATRLRPVLMTTFSTVFGYLPLVIATGAGAAARNSIGLILVGGMVIGTFFTLFVIPAMYMLIAKTHESDDEMLKDLEAANS